ncbi:MAG: PP2C family protein-serine/threonine phosphatase [Cyclobacteriaceae bacterium]|nr:PP2C family protein-serine/threonine phosphatase [Cyclobacteriaceae bacterium]
MPLNKNILRLLTFSGILSWIAMLIAGYLHRFASIHQGNAETYLFLAKLFLIAFIVSIYFSIEKIGNQDSFNILDVLWKVFVTGLVATVVSLSSNLLLTLLKNHEHGRNPYFLDTLYLINVGLIVTFLIATFSVWKRLILYQKTKWLIRLWNIFEYGLLISALMMFTNIELFNGFSLGIWGSLALLSMLLGVNLKWVAYLNFKQKWKSILLILLIALYIGYFYTILNNYGIEFGFLPYYNVLNIITINGLYIFTLIYCVFSILVVLFNLPTSSVFEQKLVEVFNFQKLSQSRNTGQNEDQVYEILLDSTVSVALANAAWLDILDEHEQVARTLYFHTDQEEKEEILKAVRKSRLKQIPSSAPTRMTLQNRFTAELKHELYKSIFVIPIFVQDQKIASLTLLRDVKEGFVKDIIDIIRTFVNQASISIENYRLMDEAIINERYKEELKIAKRVQDSLLPKRLETIDELEISAFSKAAAEVGGDYFDTYKMSDSRLALIVGDVSGKGTSAAFHMSQMKGIFQSLVQINLSVKDFIIMANNALATCLDRTSFITITYLIIDSLEKRFEYARAGHCPTLYYSAKENIVTYLEDNGLGLGILRDYQFSDYVDVRHTSYQHGDIWFLYTDGITEARNRNNEEFGYERLKTFLEKHVFYSAEYIKEAILKELHQFCGTSNLEDDITMLIIKVKGD